MKINNNINNGYFKARDSKDTTTHVDMFIIEIDKFIHRFIVANCFEIHDHLHITFNDLTLLLKRTLNAVQALATFNDNSFLIETHLNFMNRIFKKGIQSSNEDSDNVLIKQAMHITNANIIERINQQISKKKYQNKVEVNKKEIFEQYKQEQSYHVKYQRNINRKILNAGNINNNTNNSHSNCNNSNSHNNNVLTKSNSSKGSRTSVQRFTSTFRPTHSGGLIKMLSQNNNNNTQQSKNKNSRNKYLNCSVDNTTTNNNYGNTIDNRFTLITPKNTVTSKRTHSRNHNEHSPLRAKSTRSKVKNLCDTIDGHSSKRKITGETCDAAKHSDHKEIIFTYNNSKPTKYAHSLIEKGYNLLQRFERHNNSVDRTNKRCQSIE